MMTRILVLPFYIFCTAGILCCNSLFYYPTDKVYTKNIQEEHEERFIDSAGGNKLHMLYFPAKNPKALLIHFHGNARNITAHHRAFLWAVPRGYDLISWDYSGYGRSTGSPGREQIYRDSLTMLEYAVRMKEEKGYPLIAVGQSLGGAVLLGALGDFPRRDMIDLVVADCTFPSYVELSNFHVKNTTCLPIPLGNAIFTDDYAPVRAYDGIQNIPILVAHCRDDTAVPFFLGKQLYESLENKRKWFWELECKHTAGFWKIENQLRLLAFFDQEVIHKNDGQ
jgi:fermentation-respiration switch protein FrsA (DUF1100 family)